MNTQIKNFPFMKLISAIRISYFHGVINDMPTIKRLYKLNDLNMRKEIKKLPIEQIINEVINHGSVKMKKIIFTYADATQQNEMKDHDISLLVEYLRVNGNPAVFDQYVRHNNAAVRAFVAAHSTDLHREQLINDKSVMVRREVFRFGNEQIRAKMFKSLMADKNQITYKMIAKYATDKTQVANAKMRLKK